MSDVQNPFQAPEADLVTDAPNGEFSIHEPRVVSAGRGAGWLFDGFDYFKSNAGSWIAICIVGLIIMFVLKSYPQLYQSRLDLTLQVEKKRVTRFDKGVES